MDWQLLRHGLIIVQHTVSFLGIFIIISGVFLALLRYIRHMLTGDLLNGASNINDIRLNLGRVIILGLEFIVAADLIGTTTTPDYYAVGLLAIIVVIRTMLSFSINRELTMIGREN